MIRVLSHSYVSIFPDELDSAAPTAENTYNNVDFPVPAVDD
jgi:hypothetical protein